MSNQLEPANLITKEIIVQAIISSNQNTGRIERIKVFTRGSQIFLGDNFRTFDWSVFKMYR